MGSFSVTSSSKSLEEDAILDQKIVMKQSASQRWRRTLLLNACLAGGVCIINLVLTVIAVTRETHDGLYTIFSGNCQTVKLWNTAAHVLINILSTLLLAASNYGMQCLSAPTREEVDRAHKQRVWLEIGILSVRNWWYISWKRSCLWLVLAFSSLPLHFCFNSVLYSSVHSNDYTVFSASKDLFLNTTVSPDSGWNGCYRSGNLDLSCLRGESLKAELMQTKAQTGQLERLSAQDCINVYAKPFQTDRHDVILVTDLTTTSFLPDPYFSTIDARSETNTTVWTGTPKPAAPFAWICWGLPNSRSCDSLSKEIVPSHWAPFGPIVQYCLSERIAQTCRLRFNPGLALIVIVFNLIKALTLVFTWKTVNRQPLLTIGDAIASFLGRNDESTESAGWLQRWEARRWKPNLGTGPMMGRRMHSVKRRRWSNAVSILRWLSVYVPLSAFLGAIVGLLIFGILKPSDSSPQSLITSEFGGLNTNAIINSWPVVGIVQNVLVANVPQVLLSLIYVQYNGVFTGMTLGAEWNQFASTRKGLRVSASPTGAQRTTYFLQLPYRVAFPLMALSATIHWICSQSFFLVAITLGRIDDTVDERITCGYSPPAILTGIIAGLIMMLAIFMVGRKRYSNVMPVAGSCSLAISAACHPAPGKEGREDPTLPVQWGRSEDLSTKDVQEVHYSFSSRHVFPFLQEA